MDFLLQQIVEFMQNRSAGTRWILVPTPAGGHTLGERLAREGIAWANLRFTTAIDLAASIAGPILGARGFTKMDYGVGPALLLQLLLDLPPETPRYFRKIADQPGVAEALWKAVREFRLGGLSFADLRAEAFKSREKHAELTALLEAYELELKRSSLADEAAVLCTASDAAHKVPVLEASEVLELPGSCRSMLERCFIDSLPWRRCASRIAGVAGSNPPEWWRRLNPAVEIVGASTDMPSDVARLAWIVKPAEASEPLKDDTLTLFRAAGREAEVEEVLRRIQRDLVPLDSVEILCAQPNKYGPMLWEKAARYDIPVTIETGIPGTLTRPVQAALALCGWIERGFPAVRLARMFESGLLGLGDSAGVSSSAAARLLRHSAATAGRATYSIALVNLAVSLEERSKNPDRDVGACAIRTGSVAGERRYTGRGFQGCLRRFLKHRRMAPLFWAISWTRFGGRSNVSALSGSPEDIFARTGVVSALCAARTALRHMPTRSPFELALLRAQMVDRSIDLSGVAAPEALHCVARRTQLIPAGRIHVRTAWASKRALFSCRTGRPRVAR